MYAFYVLNDLGTEYFPSHQGTLNCHNCYFRNNKYAHDVITKLVDLWARPAALDLHSSHITSELSMCCGACAIVEKWSAVDLQLASCVYS